jgi:stalled ribosome rescue protein Dom34
MRLAEKSGGKARTGREKNVRSERRIIKDKDMNSHYHAIIWIDHQEARVFHFGRLEADRLVLHPHNPTHHIHHKANSIGSGHAAEDQDFLHRVAQSVADAGGVLITGPANAKTELVKHIHRHDPMLMNLIVGVETVDHPSDGALVGYARRYFKAADMIPPQML